MAVSPASATLQIGQAQTFTATVTGSSNTNVAWSVVEGNGGSVSAAGTYAAPGTAGSYHVIATSVADSTRSAQATVTVTAPPAQPGIASFTANPSTILAGQSSMLAWSVANATSLSIDQGVGAVAGTSRSVSPGATTTYTLTATGAGGIATSLAQVMVIPAPVITVSVNPSSANLQTAQTQPFTATVTGTGDPSVLWSVVEAGGGMVGSGGLYTAPGAAGTYHVKATSVADATKSDQATVTVTAMPPQPSIASFTAAPSTITAGQSCLLSWSVANTASLSIDQGVGTVTGTSRSVSPEATATYTLTAAGPGGTVTSQALVTVNPAPPITVSVSPNSASLHPGQAQPFAATETGTANNAVTWSVVEAGGGTITAGGIYTAPGATGTYHVKATSVADSTKSAQAAVTVTPTPTITVSISPATANLAAGMTQPFTATVTGTGNTAVTWSVVEAGGGTVSTSGLYTAPGTAGTYHVKVASVADTTKSAQAAATVTAPNSAPSNYLFLTAARLAAIRADAAANRPAWIMLKQNVDDNLTLTDSWDTGPENFALVYLVTGDSRYAARAFWWAQQRMGMDLRRDSYYDFGEMLQGVAIVHNYCAPALSAAQLKSLADFLDASADELWNHNQGSGWGLDNPRNNYHHNFLMGTAYAGYALKAAGDARGDQWIALLKNRLEKPGGVLDYLTNGVPGGDWDEGVNYAEGSKMHLALALSVVAGAGGTNYFNSLPFFANQARFALYATQPGGHFMYPGGDLARDSSMGLCPYERAYIQPTVFWLNDSEGRQLGQFFLNHLMPTYMDGDHSFNFRTGLYLEVLFGLDIPEKDQATLPTSYHTPTTNWVNLRSGWDAGATSLSISGSPRIFESHQHMDTGSFTLWKGDWQAPDSSTFSHSGEIMVAEAHNLLRVPHAVWLTDETTQIPGMTHFGDKGAFGYAQVDVTRLYREVFSSEDIRDLLNEHTREFVYLRPNQLVVFDRVNAKADGQGYAWCMHFPVSPVLSGSRYSANYQGNGISLVKLLGGASSVVSDADLEAGTTSFRVEEAASGAVSRYLNVVEVASIAAPPTAAQLVSTPGSVQGALLGMTVILFSDAAKGVPATLPFSYTVPGTLTLTHILCNLSATVDIAATTVSGNTQVTVSAGSHFTPDASGVVSLTLSH